MKRDKRERPLHADEIVITPTGRRAQIRVVSDEGYCELKYIDHDGAMTPSARAVTVHESLLRRWQRGRDAPPPVRVALNGRRI